MRLDLRHAVGRAALIALCAAVTTACPRGTPEGVASGSPGDSLEFVLTHADGAFKQGDYREAQSAYEEALQIAPGDRHITANLATCYFKLRREKKAHEILTRHLRDDPQDVASRLLLARVLIRQGDLETAAEALRAVVRTAPDNLLGQYNLGFVAYRLRLYDEARTHLLKTLELSPEHPEAHYTLGLVHLAQGRPEEAIASLERAVAINPQHVGARFNLVNACARAGRMEEAQRHQEAYLELSGRSDRQAVQEQQIKSSSVKAVQYLLEKKYPEALAEYQALSGEYPDYAPLHNAIGLVQLRLGRRPEALEALKKAAALDPRLAEPHYLLANLYSEMGEEQAAARERAIFQTLDSIPEKPSY